LANDAPVPHSRALDLTADLTWLGARMPRDVAEALRRDDVEFSWRSDGRRTMLTRFGEDTIWYTFWRYGSDGKPDKGPLGTGHAARITRGWPFPCVEGSTWSAGAMNAPIEQTMLVIDGGTRGYKFPYRPLWLGLLGNAVFWGAFMLVLRMLPPWTESFLRRRRGLRPRCAYPLHGARRCPECGTDGTVAINNRSPASATSALRLCETRI